jgi:hypothetical protein
MQSSFAALLRQFVVRARELGQLADDEDPDQLTFELKGIILAANTNFVLHQDPRALDLARRVVRRRLGVTFSRGSERGVAHLHHHGAAAGSLVDEDDAVVDRQL